MKLRAFYLDAVLSSPLAFANKISSACEQVITGRLARLKELRAVMSAVCRRHRAMKMSCFVPASQLGAVCGQVITGRRTRLDTPAVLFRPPMAGGLER